MGYISAPLELVEPKLYNSSNYGLDIATLVACYGNLILTMCGNRIRHAYLEHRGDTPHCLGSQRFLETL